MIDLAKLAAVPTPAPLRSAAIERGIADSVAYLGSDSALRSIEVDVYWPKWHGPWWHMLLLHELGEARRIPPQTSAAVVAGLDGLLHIFPIRPDDAPAADPHRDIACHCALGTMYAVLAACGIDVDRALPWVKPWFTRYQMADGGLNCDESAYLQTHECPSSMVATVAPLEAMLVGTSWSSEERTFLDRAAHFMIDRALVHGSQTTHNADEHSAAPAWRRLAFPRASVVDPPPTDPGPPGPPPQGCVGFPNGTSEPMCGAPATEGAFCSDCYGRIFTREISPANGAWPS